MGVLEGKRIVVTGSGQGLGRAYAMAMAREGAKLVINDFEADAAEQTVADIAAEGGAAVINIDDVSDYTAAKRIIETCVEAYGGIDALVNNAGVGYVRQIFESSEEDFDRIIGINLKGTFNCARHAVDWMIEQKRGVILNVSSGAAGGVQGRAFYAATKGGVSAFTYSWALELAPHNIRVNAIAPYARTRRTVGTFTAMAGKLDSLPTPEDIAPIAVFLASDAAAYVNGQVVGLAGETLSIYSHPRSVRPVVRKGGWTAEEIRAVFEQHIKPHLEPVGAVAGGYRYYDGVGV